MQYFKNTKFSVSLQKDMLYKNPGKRSVNFNNLITVWGTILSSLLKTFQKLFIFARYGTWPDPQNTKSLFVHKIFQKTLKTPKSEFYTPKRYDWAHLSLYYGSAPSPRILVTGTRLQSTFFTGSKVRFNGSSIRDLRHWLPISMFLLFILICLKRKQMNYMSKIWAEQL